MHQKTLAELREGLIKREFSSVEVTQHFLERIARLDERFNCFISVTEDAALARAREADKTLAAGGAPALCGLPDRKSVV